MGNLKYKTEGGHKRGHSNMEHWAYTEEIKDATRKRRRAESKKIIRDEVTHENNSSIPEPLRVAPSAFRIDEATGLR